MPAKRHLAGQPFGRLTVIESAPAEAHKTGLRTWICRCECGAVGNYLTSQLTSGRITECPKCSPIVPAIKSQQKCVVCGAAFLGHFNGKVCSNECRKARRRGTDAGVEHLPPPVYICEWCGKEFAGYAGQVTCSDKCQRQRQRKRWREDYYRRMKADPDLAKRVNRKRRARAAIDPEYAEKLRLWDAKKHARHRDRMSSNPDYAARHRKRTNDIYARHAEVVQKRRKARLDAMSTTELDAWMRRAKKYCREWRQKWRGEIYANPDEHQKYISVMAEYRSRLAAQKLGAQLTQLRSKLESQLEDTDESIS